jgi:hypothetical protein
MIIAAGKKTDGYSGIGFPLELGIVIIPSEDNSISKIFLE